MCEPTFYFVGDRYEPDLDTEEGIALAIKILGAPLVERLRKNTARGSDQKTFEVAAVDRKKKTIMFREVT